MDSATLVPLALAFGVVIGTALTAVFVASAHRGQRAVAVVSTAVPDGVDQVIEAL